MIKQTREDKIAVVKADKGGALLIVDPNLLDDSNLYNLLESDPTNSLSDELFSLWLFGKKPGFISDYDAQKVMGITDLNNKSTSSHFKPGTSYFYPMLKIHKLSRDELKPGVKPPARLVTALHEGISKRSDVFVAERFLKELEQEYCEDLQKDTNSVLSWLDTVNTNYSFNEKRNMKAFTFDFKSLYDNLKPALVKKAIEHAMQTCRPNWSRDKKKWVLKLVDISLRASVGKYKDQWYIQKNGVPTGGSLCVQLANIAVYYIMNLTVYSKPNMMQNIKQLKRYIDDGAGFYTGSTRSFLSWMNLVNAALQPYGLLIDESIIKDVGEFVPFLDILFCFDINGDLQTDLYVKPTDARSYLNFGSAHPNHTFSGIVYSQCLRLRRIINDNNRLKIRINELCSDFLKSGYPKNMLKNISTKILGLQRVIIPNRKVQSSEPNKAILVVSSHGTDEKLVNSLKSHEEDILKTNSFKDKRKPLFRFVKKTGPNLGSMLSVVKFLALGKKSGKTIPCLSHGNCKCCSLIINDDINALNGIPLRTAPGNCKTNNIIYLVSCKMCSKSYIGRTTQPLGTRMNGHRKCYYKVLRSDNIDTNLDDFSLGLHLLHDHGLEDPKCFNDTYETTILEVCSPSLLERKEHCFIHKFNTLFPHGLNKSIWFT